METNNYVIVIPAVRPYSRNTLSARNETTMTHVTKDSPDLEIRIECLPEEIEVRGNAMSSGDPSVDRSAEDQIIAALDRGNLWAWCTAHVSVTYKGVISGSDVLGACSYESEDDFRRGGYFDDMVSTCIAEINSKLEGFPDDTKDQTA